MRFFKQLWLLIWKNLSLRKRQLLRNVVEIVWPLTIFLILANVRTRKEAKHLKEFFFKPRALPSAGVLPFMQSFLCDFDNPTTPYQEELPDYSNTSFYKLAQDLGPVLQNRTNLELISRLQDDYNKLIKSLRDTQLLETTGITNNASLSSILKNATVVRKFIKEHTTFNDTYVDALMNGKINVTQAIKLYMQSVGQVGNLDVRKILTLMFTLKPTLCGSPGLKSIFILPKNISADVLQDQLCKLSTAEWGTLVRDIYSNIDQKALNNTFRNKELFDTFMKRRKEITDEVTQLLKDMRSLQSLQNVLGDLGVAATAARSTQNLTSGAWQLSNLLCGRNRKSTSSLKNLNSSVSQVTETAGGARERSSSTTKGTCSNIPLKNRTECGWSRITKGTCLSMGCCFDKSTKGNKTCFCKPGNEFCCKQFRGLVSLIGGSRKEFVNMFALILRGKIFYTPDTPQTRRVVQQANLFIKQIESGIRSLVQLKQPIATLINIANTYQNTSATVRESMNLEAFSLLLGIPYTNQIMTLYNQTDLVLKRLYEERGLLQVTHNSIDLIGNILDCFNISDYFQPFPDEKSMVKRATDQALDKPLFLSSIVFLNFDAKDGSFPKQAEYKLRLNPAYTPGTKYVRSRYWRPGPSWNGYNGTWTKFYINFGFVFLQDMLDRAIMEIITNKTILEPGVYTQQFPYPCFIRDAFTAYISSSLPLFMVLAWVYSSAMTVKSIVLEKELRLKEVMKVMGLSDAVHWAAWFITSLLFMLLSVIILCILFKAGKILMNSNPVVIFWLLTSFGLATISLSCLISVFFSKANVSAACGGIIYFFTYLPFSFTIWFEDQMTYSHKATANLLSTTGFGMACRYLARWEEQGDGAQWSNYYKSPMPGDEYSLGTCVNMMLLDAVLYFIILWYIENVMPGEFGIPRKWYFPFTKSYWLGSCSRKSRYESYEMEVMHDESSNANGNCDGQYTNENFEADPFLKVGVNIQNLVKVYKRGKKRAVDGLSLKLYEGQVTSLLGHNGAGKSTTMSVLTGLIPPTKGTAVVYGSDIRTDIEGARSRLGICPQHNVLFDHLTVEEHMWFYAQLKGMPKKDIKDEIEKFLKDVGLPKKRNELSMNLSGGMKRKLSVALAFIANSKTVILDEPTAGVDPYSRRSIWDLILSYKAEKTILLSTHYMDEADLLGDRISIIAHGQLRCCGTPLFLKRRFGEGYHLTLSKDVDPASSFDENAVMNFMSSQVSGSSLKESSATEQCFVLPSQQRQNGSFKALFQNLEKSCNSLGINSYGISDTSLEEVFLKVTEQDEDVFDGDVFFKPRALPSAGVLPFMQSFLCDFDNPTTPYQEELPDYSNTSFYKLAQDLGPVLQNRTNLELISRLQDDYNKLIKSLRDTQLLETTGITNNASLSSILKNATVVRKFIKEHTTFNDTYVDALMNGKINVTQAIKLYMQSVGQVGNLDVRKILTLMFTLKPTLCGSPGLKSIFILPKNISADVLQDQLCKLSTAEWGTLVRDIYSNIDQKALNNTFRNKELFDTFMKRRKEITDEVTQLLKDMRSLQSLQNVLGDLGVAATAARSTQNLTSGAWQLSNLLCGRNRKSTSSLKNLNSSVSQVTETAGGARERSSSTTKGTCSNIPLKNRTECGWSRITKGTCLSMGCCFDKSTKGNKTCFCKPGNEFCCKQFRGLVSLIGGSRKEFVNMFALILRGKIFYTPDTPQTRRVVQQANLFIKQIESGIRSLVQLKQPIATLINIANTYQNTSATVRESMNLEAFSLLLGIPYTNQIMTLYNQTDLVLKRLYEERGLLQVTHNSIDLIGNILDCFNISDYFQPFPDEKSMVKRATDQALDKPLFLSSIVFLNFDAKDGSFPKQAEYKLRLNPAYTPGTKYVRSRYWRPGPSWNGYNGTWTKFYINFGFVFLQDMLDRAIMEIITNKTILEPGVYTQQFPYPCFIRDAFTAYISSSLPLFMVLAWVYSSAMTVKSIVLEKELRLKEVMKVMGLSDAVHWAAWFITSLLFMLLSVIILCILFKAGKILMNSNPVVIFWLLTSFGLATISLSCLISVFFSKANVSAACGGIIYFFTYLPFSFTIWFEDQMTYSHKATANLLSTTGFGMACRYLARWEEQGDGAQWSNYYKSPMPGDEYSLGTCVNMMLLDAVLYFIILWYIENVMPGEFGIPRKWYFPFTKSYWLGSCSRKSRYESYEMEVMHDESSNANGNCDGQYTNENFEADPFLKVGVNIQNLVKVYKRGKKRAVDGLSLKLYEGQVTSLLGHNGAGKSTTMSVLTGLIPPTKGTAVVYGSDIRTDIEGARSRLGICPQHNVLFDHLTVEEHMWFYAQLKGMPKKDIKDEIEKFLKDVGLPKKRNELSMNLSGGMKRKLSVALAFIANSKTVILDEPTAGVDPYSRRSIWDLILSYKAEKTILLSTHYMDEADLLGDRISIIAHGQLRCCGTPLFLKRRFGEGYHLTLSKDVDPASSFDENAVMNFMSSQVSGSSLKESSATEQCFVLPSQQRQNGSFKALFQNLEKSCNSLGINSYGISDTSLEEVFLKVTEQDEDVFDGDDAVSLTGPTQRRLNSLYDTESLYSTSSGRNLISSETFMEESSDRAYADKKEGISLWLQQFFALLIKRFHHARRGRKGFISQILLPAVFVAVAMAVSLLRPPRTPLPSLKLSPSQFSDPNYVFISNVNKDSKVSKRVTEACVRSPGIGTDCMSPASCSKAGNPFPFASDVTRWNFSSTYKNLPVCSCATGKQICPKNSYGSKPPTRKLNTKDILIDLTGRNISEYLLKTTDDFVKRRYGGLSIGDMSNYFPRTNFSAQSSRNISASNRSISIAFSTSGVQLNAKVWFNNKGYHALPTYLNVLNNAILRANLNPDQDPRQYGIVAYNHPMDFNKEQLGDETMMQGFTDLLVSIFVIIALSFVPSSFVVYLVADRNSKSKHLQLVSGLNPIVYWLGNYVWDMINYLIPATFCLVIFLAFNQESYVSADNFPATVCLLLLYGWSMTPLMYPTSFFFDVPSTAYIVLICTNLFVGIVGTISTFILELFSDDAELQTINGYLKQIFLIFPNYCLGRGFMDLARNQFMANVYAVFGESKFKDPFSWSLVGRNMFSMFMCGLAYFILTILIQYRFFIKFRPGKPAEVVPKNEDEDVSKERMRVQTRESEDTDVLRITDLTKVYRSRFSRKKLLAVDRLSFGLGKGECFGLLGVNGAGKTTTFKMLTGDTDVTAGNAFVGKSSILRDVNNARKQVGYCPQFDAFDELLTAREMLSYYARIRGIQRQYIPEIVEWGINMMDLTLYADKICGDYSGGNKRKLSTAIAFLGNPQLIFLDEPTTGMDPGARRFLWNIITDIVKSGRSVVLTSHSMEECEALCTRLGIMVNGKFTCFGSPQHLRSKHGDGYTIGIRAKITEMICVQAFMKANFPNSVLKDQHHYMLEYQVPSADLLLSEVFAKLEILQATNSIHDYSVTQTTLDQVFVNFARKQTEGIELDADTAVVVAVDSETQSEA